MKLAVQKSFMGKIVYRSPDPHKKRRLIFFSLNICENLHISVKLRKKVFILKCEYPHFFGEKYQTIFTEKKYINRGT